jgi:bifunctional DNA-binding transcriptional regulator/antitoxin component of YhaV-PrlF toxin-antitoxin module
MPVSFRRKVVKIGGSLRLTLPPELAESLKIKPGDMVEYTTTDGSATIRKVKKV